MIGEGKAPLGCGRGRGVDKRMFGAKDGDISRDRGIGVHRGSKVFTLRRGDEDVVGVDGDVLVERGEEEGVKNLLSDLGGCGRHRW